MKQNHIILPYTLGYDSHVDCFVKVNFLSFVIFWPATLSKD